MRRKAVHSRPSGFCRGIQRHDQPGGKEAVLGLGEATLGRHEAALGSSVASRRTGKMHAGVKVLLDGNARAQTGPRRPSAAGLTANLVTGARPGFIGTTCCT